MMASKRAYQKTYKYLIHTPSPNLLSLDIQASTVRISPNMRISPNIAAVFVTSQTMLVKNEK